MDLLIKRVRLIGVAVSNLRAEQAPEQLSLFGDTTLRYRQLSRARDSIIGKFGKQAIERASLLGA